MQMLGGGVCMAWSDGADNKTPTSPMSARFRPPMYPCPIIDDMWSLAWLIRDSLKRRLHALHGDHVRDLEASTPTLASTPR
jgi:hypothetical protein